MRAILAGLSDFKVRVEFLRETHRAKEDQPPDTLLKLHFVPNKDPKSVFFSAKQGFQQPV
jgi:hypothetical protein